MVLSIIITLELIFTFYFISFPARSLAILTRDSFEAPWKKEHQISYGHCVCNFVLKIHILLLNHRWKKIIIFPSLSDFLCVWNVYVFVLCNQTSMTSLLYHIVAHSTRNSFRPKTNNQHLEKFLSLLVSRVKVVKSWTSF